MKKLLFLLVSLLFISCYQKGTVRHEPTEFIEIHGKIYKLMSVTPCTGCNAIWIMYPKDSLDSQPQIINYDVSNGKFTSNQTIIKVD